ncbi:hypothetical protein Esti_005422 [Eimeria stiedai]
MFHGGSPHPGCLLCLCACVLLPGAGLESLRLDNNFLRDVGSSLKSLSKLRWLDLSFNRIEKLSGLETLKQLQDLSVSHNLLSSFEGIEACASLSVVCATHNLISSLKGLLPLRRLPLLRSLSLADNPYCLGESTREQLLSLLPALEYLNFKLLSPEEKATAAESLLPEQHQQLLELVASLEATESQQQQQQQQDGWFQIQHDLAADVFGEKTIPAGVKCLNCLRTHRDAFFQAVGPLVAATRKELEEKGLALQRRMASFGRVAKALELAIEKSTIAELRQTDTRRRQVLAELHSLTEQVLGFGVGEARQECRRRKEHWTKHHASVSSGSSESQEGSAAEAMEALCASLEASFKEQQETVSQRLLQQEQQLAEAVVAATATLETETDAAIKQANERTGDLMRQQQQALSALEDALQQQLQQQQKDWFAAERQRQTLRHRQRLREIHSVAADSQQHVAAAAARLRSLLSGGKP